MQRYTAEAAAAGPATPSAAAPAETPSDVATELPAPLERTPSDGAEVRATLARGAASSRRLDAEQAAAAAKEKEDLKRRIAERRARHKKG